MMTKVKVVHGSPLSGKSTYAKDNIQENSIVYEYDRLETSLTYKVFFHFIPPSFEYLLS